MAGGFLRPPGNKIPADPHDLHDVIAVDALEVAHVDLGVDGDDGLEAEVEVQTIVQLGRAGRVAVLGSAGGQLAGVGLREHLRGDLIRVIGQLRALLVVDGQRVAECDLVLHGVLLSENKSRPGEGRPCLLQQAADLLVVVLAADAEDLVELVDQPVFRPVDEKLVAADRVAQLVLALAAGIHGQAGDRLGHDAEKRLAADGLGGSVCLLDVLHPAELERSAVERGHRAQAHVGADLVDGRLHSLDLADDRQRQGAHRLEVSSQEIDGRQRDGHVLGDQFAGVVHSVSQYGAVEVDPCHYSSPPS